MTSVSNLSMVKVKADRTCVPHQEIVYNISKSIPKIDERIFQLNLKNLGPKHLEFLSTHALSVNGLNLVNCHDIQSTNLLDLILKWNIVKLSRKNTTMTF